MNHCSQTLTHCRGARHHRHTMSFRVASKSAYEIKIDENVARNNRVISDLGLTKLVGPTTIERAPTKKVVELQGTTTVPTVPAMVRPARSNGEGAKMASSFGSSRLVELKFPMKEADGDFKLMAFVDCVDRDAIRSVNFVLRSVQQNLCPELPEWKFKKQCSKKNSTINAYFGSQLTQATKSQMMELKAKCPTICGDRTVTLNLAPLNATMEFLSSNGREKHAMCIEANLSAALESTTNVTNSGTQDNATSSIASSGVAGEPRDYHFYSLTSEQITPKLASDIESAKAWWIRPVESQRQGSKAIKESSWGVKERRCKLFLGWVLREHNIEPSIELFEKVPLVEAYTDWLRTRAEAKAHAQARSVRVSSAIIESYSVAVTFVKWLNRNHASKGKKWNKVDAIEQFRELEQQAWNYKNDNEVPLSNSADPNWVELDELDKARESLEERFDATPSPSEGASDSEKKEWADALQDLVLISIWTLLPPLRSQVPRTLRLLQYNDPTQDNRISWLEKEGCYALWFPKSKTCAKQKNVTLPLPAEMNNIIEQFVKVALPIKLAAAKKEEVDCGFNSGCPLFLSPRDAVPFSISNFCSFAKNMWHRHLGVPMPAHNLRRIYVTDLLLRETSISTREAAAHAMGHSTQTQSDIYNRCNQRQAVQLALTDIQGQQIARKRAREAAPPDLVAATTPATKRPSLNKSSNNNQTSTSIVDHVAGKKKLVDTTVHTGESIDYELRGIRDVRPKHTSNGTTSRGVEFKCVWEEYPSDDCAWEPPKNFVSPQAQAMCVDFVKQAKSNFTWVNTWWEPAFTSKFST